MELLAPLAINEAQLMLMDLHKHLRFRQASSEFVAANKEQIVEYYSSLDN